jgi:hypothetical protein
MSPTLIDRLHAFLARAGISPKVADPVILAVIAIVAHWVVTGEFDATELRLAGATALYALVGLTAPPAAGVRQEQVDRMARKRP